MLQIYAGQSHPNFAAEVASHLGTRVTETTVEQFPNANIKVQIRENARGSDAFVIQTAPPEGLHDYLFELLILIDALKYASAKRITAVLPYYSYSRSDKKDEPRISITARLMADLLQTAGADRILAINLHAPQIMGMAHIPMDQLDAIPLLTDYLGKRDLSNAVAVAPDIGRAKVTEAYARRLGLPVVVLDKRRIGGDVVIQNVIGEVEGKDCIFFDDELLTGGSIFAGVEALKRHGARNFRAAVVHGFLADDAIDKVESSDLDELIVTNTLPQTHGSSKITVLSVAALFANAIDAIHKGGSVSSLFR